MADLWPSTLCRPARPRHETSACRPLWLRRPTMSKVFAQNVWPSLTSSPLAWAGSKYLASLPADRLAGPSLCSNRTLRRSRNSPFHILQPLHDELPHRGAALVHIAAFKLPLGRGGGDPRRRLFPGRPHKLCIGRNGSPDDRLAGFRHDGLEVG